MTKPATRNIGWTRTKTMTTAAAALLLMAGTAHAAEPGAAPGAGGSPAATPAAAPAGAASPATAPGFDAPVVNTEKRDNGLVIEDVVVGEGPVVAEGAAVVAHYRGTLKVDGSEFDSSYKRLAPATFPLKGVIQGWQQGVPGMKVGGKRRLTVPAALAYGEREIKRGGNVIIPSNAELVFEIELVAVLQMEDLVVGQGEELLPGGSAKVNYRGTLKSDGSEFDSSYSRNQPFTFSTRGGVIPGWLFGVPGMKEGGKRKLTIPWQMAYGEQGSPPKIGPRADLVFEIELLDANNEGVSPPPAAPAAAPASKPAEAPKPAEPAKPADAPKPAEAPKPDGR